MPLPADHWFVDIEKEYLGEYWTNRYVVLAPTRAQAAIYAGEIAEMERTWHKTVVLFTKFRVSDDNPATDNYQVSNLNVYGTAPVNGDLLPLFNVMRVDFNVSGGGRPSRKYYRLPMGEFDQANGTITSGALSVWNAAVANLATGGYYRDVDGQVIIDASVYPKVGMRQLRRGSKRKAPTTSP